MKGSRHTVPNSSKQTLRLLAQWQRGSKGLYNDVLRQELTIGLTFTLPQNLTVEQMNNVLSEACRENPGVRNLVWATPEGRSIASNLPGAIGLDITKRPHYQQIIAGSDYVVSDLYTSQVDDAPCFSISRGIRDKSGNLLGIIIAIIVPENLDQALAVERAKGGGVSLVDSKGMLVYRYPHINPTWEQRYWLDIMPQIRKALAGEEVAWIGKTTYTDKTRIMANVPVHSVGWSAGAGRTEDDAMAAGTSTLLLDATLSTIVFLAAFGTALVRSSCRRSA